MTLAVSRAHAHAHARRASTPSTRAPPAPVPVPAAHRRLRSRDFWSTLGAFAGYAPKAASEGRLEPEEMMDVDIVDDVDVGSISLTLPPSLPSCSISAAFQNNGSTSDIPPAFYPGQTIPTILTFELDRFSSLPHSLNPLLTMSLVGTLHVPHHVPRTIICVSVSLAEGLALWARDAAAAHALRAPRDRAIDPRDGLPGGTYTLPLTVQVPSTPKLPASFAVPNATFAVTYALTVSLTCDDPMRPGGRVVLAEVARPFEMMPETLPTRAPRLNPTTLWVRSEAALGPLARRPNSRWTIQPSLPTSSYSPTSVIPISLIMTPPPVLGSCAFHILVRLSLHRQERSNLFLPAGAESTEPEVVSDTEISSRWLWLDTRTFSDGAGTGTDTPRPVVLSDLALPVMCDGRWPHGFSTMLHVDPPAHTSGAHAQSIAVSSTFHVGITIAFMPVSDDRTVLDALALAPAPGAAPLRPGELSTPMPPSHPHALSVDAVRRRIPGTCRTLTLPVVIGSVSEPRGAMHAHRWQDVVDDAASADTAATPTGRRRQAAIRTVEGESVSCENGWMVPPPAYEVALEQAPYVYERAR
ncbi:hypothetical protein Q5752_005958 [Cryptotrichosporon argae]